MFKYLLFAPVNFHCFLPCSLCQPTETTLKGLQCSLVPLYWANEDPWQVVRRREENKNEVFILLAPFLKVTLSQLCPSTKVNWSLHVANSIRISFAVSVTASLPCPFKSRGKLLALNNFTNLIRSFMHTVGKFSS